MNKVKIIDTLKKKIQHAKNEDGDFVFIPVWQAKQLVEYLEPMPPTRSIIGWQCARCNHKLVANGFFQQEYCDECGQKVDWP